MHTHLLLCLDMTGGSSLSPQSRQEVLSKTTLDVLHNTSPAEVIKPAPEAETVRGPANRSGGWLHGTAQFGLFLRRQAPHSSFARLPQKT